jgi:hypothetical protein
MTRVESRSLSQVVEHAGAYAHLAAGAQRYGLHDGVAVLFAVSQRQQDV